MRKEKKYKFFPPFRAWIIFDENDPRYPYSRYVFINRFDAEEELKNQKIEIEYPTNFEPQKLTIRSVIVKEVSKI